MREIEEEVLDGSRVRVDDRRLGGVGVESRAQFPERTFHEFPGEISQLSTEKNV